MKQEIKTLEITAENYEAFLLDYFEGRISEEHTCALLSFIDKNPQLNIELNDFECITLNAEPASFPFKNQLYRTQTNEMEMKRSDFLLVKHLEDELTSDEKAELKELIAITPELKQEASRMTRTRLTAGSELFTGKNRLKRVGLLPILTHRRAQQTAAILILLLLSTTLWMVNPFEASEKKNMADAHPKLIQQQEKVMQEDPIQQLITDTPQPEVKKIILTSKEDPDNQLIRESTPVILKQKEMPLMKPLQARQVKIQEEASINAYELGVNHMMPTYVALLQNNNKPNQNEPAASSTRTLSILQGSIKVLNALSGNDIKLEKELDDTGNVVAFTVQTETAIINKQLRQ